MVRQYLEHPCVFSFFPANEIDGECLVGCSTPTGALLAIPPEAVFAGAVEAALQVEARRVGVARERVALALVDVCQR
jgi:hypothetical protein